MSINNKRSYTEYTVTTATTDFVIGFDEYDDGTKDTIVVTVNGVLAESQGYAVIRKNAQVLTITPAVQSGTVRLTRETDIDEPFHKFTAGALFSAKSVDENFEQIQHSQQEVRDAFVYTTNYVNTTLSAYDVRIVEVENSQDSSNQRLATEIQARKQGDLDSRRYVEDILGMGIVWDGISTRSVIDAVTGLTQADINAAPKLDTDITATAKHAGALTRTQAEKNDDVIDIRDFTSPNDTDHTSGLNAAAAVALAENKVLTGAGTYKIKSGDVNFRFLRIELGACKFIVTEPYMIILGGNAGTTQNPNQTIGVVQNPTTSLSYSFTDNPTIRVMGAKNQHIKIGFVQYLQFYQTTDPSTYPRDASQAYSTFDIAIAVKLSIDTDPTYASGSRSDGAGSANQWFNENTFNLRRCYGFFMRGSYKHNHNVVNGGSFENVSTIRIESGNKNQFKNIRFEGTTNSIYLGEATQGNIIEKSWFGSEANFWTVPTLTDLGTLNSVRTVYEVQGTKKSLLALSNLDTTYNKQQVSGFGRAASKQAIKSREDKYTLLASSKMFPLVKGDYIFGKLQGGSNDYYVVHVELYDANRRLISDLSSTPFESSLTVSESGYFTGGITPTATVRFASLGDIAKYAKITLYSTTIARSNATAINFFTFTTRSSFDVAYDIIGHDNIRTNITVKPTEFVGRVGDTVKTLDNQTFTCVHAIDGYLTSSADSDATTVVVNSFYDGITGSSKVGDLIGIELDSNLTHWTTIDSIKGTTITLTTALTSAASIDASVYTCRLT